MGADTRGVKAGNRLMSVVVAGASLTITDIEARVAGGLDTLPIGVLELGFADPDSVNPLKVEVPQSWHVEDEAAYPVDIWSSADGIKWTLDSQHDWPGQAGCNDGF